MVSCLLNFSLTKNRTTKFYGLFRGHLVPLWIILAIKQSLNITKPVLRATFHLWEIAKQITCSEEARQVQNEAYSTGCDPVSAQIKNNQKKGPQKSTPDPKTKKHNP
jgi:hypothetical protein